jgi:hypothetical protein
VPSTAKTHVCESLKLLQNDSSAGMTQTFSSFASCVTGGTKRGSRAYRTSVERQKSSYICDLHQRMPLSSPTGLARRIAKPHCRSELDAWAGQFCKLPPSEVCSWKTIRKALLECFTQLGHLYQNIQSCMHRMETKQVGRDVPTRGSSARARPYTRTSPTTSSQTPNSQLAVCSRPLFTVTKAEVMRRAATLKATVRAAEPCARGWHKLQVQVAGCRLQV